MRKSIILSPILLCTFLTTTKADELYGKDHPHQLNHSGIFTASVLSVSFNHPWILYPVPFTGEVILQYMGVEKIKGVIGVFVLNSTGKIVNRLRSSSLSKTIKVPVENLCRGVYTVIVMIQDQVVWTGRFIKINGDCRIE